MTCRMQRMTAALQPRLEHPLWLAEGAARSLWSRLRAKAARQHNVNSIRETDAASTIAQKALGIACVNLLVDHGSPEAYKTESSTNRRGFCCESASHDAVPVDGHIASQQCLCLDTNPCSYDSVCHAGNVPAGLATGWKRRCKRLSAQAVPAGWRCTAVAAQQAGPDLTGSQGPELVRFLAACSKVICVSPSSEGNDTRWNV